mgnify:CR=1 FL=1
MALGSVLWITFWYRLALARAEANKRKIDRYLIILSNISESNGKFLKRCRERKVSIHISILYFKDIRVRPVGFWTSFDQNCPNSFCKIWILNVVLTYFVISQETFFVWFVFCSLNKFLDNSNWKRTLLIEIFQDSFAEGIFLIWHFFVDLSEIFDGK